MSALIFKSLIFFYILSICIFIFIFICRVEQIYSNMYGTGVCVQMRNSLVEFLCLHTFYDGFDFNCSKNVTFWCCRQSSWLNLNFLHVFSVQIYYLYVKNECAHSFIHTDFFLIPCCCCCFFGDITWTHTSHMLLMIKKNNEIVFKNKK